MSDKTIALAGLYLALNEIQNIAWEGDYTYADIDTSLQSVFITDPKTFIEVYGSVDQLRPGLQALRTSFREKNNPKAVERARYMVSLMVLSQKVTANKQLGEQIKTTLSLLEEASKDLPNQRDYIIERLAQLYRNTLSNLSPKIIVYGKPEILNNENNAAAIRALLFCGVRSALLWYQAGGSQINLLIGKSKYLKTIDKILD